MEGQYITISGLACPDYQMKGVVWERTQPAIQELVDDAPKAKQYFSDAFDAYDRLASSCPR